MSFFETECDKISNGTIDLLSIEDNQKDNLVIALYKDMGEPALALAYIIASNSRKNHHYSKIEHVLLSLIEKRNKAIDDSLVFHSEEIENPRSFVEPPYKYYDFNRDIYEAGHKYSDF